MASTRTYTMRKRAETVEATRARILDSARTHLIERLDPEAVSLDDVGRAAGVTAMTVLRHFASKPALLAEVEDRERARIIRSREAPPGNVAEAVRILYDHYEDIGDWGVRTQAMEGRSPRIKKMLGSARVAHRAWVETTFAPQLKRIDRKDRDDVVTSLVIACDLLTWKQLRRDLGLPRSQAESIVRRMITSLCKGGV